MANIKRTRKRLIPLLYVMFADHAAASGWKGPGDNVADEKDLICHACGWLIKETNKLLILGAFVDGPDPRWSAARVIIIKSAIICRKRLRIP